MVRLDEILQFEEQAADQDGGDDLATPFERWCERNGLHPEAPGAWAVYERSERPI